ncbi:MAG TPA: TIGR02996 domain-containing protein, partial [Kofleriaceae bacterium]
MPPVSELLARATSAIAEREPRAALEAMRAAWCEAPDPRIALAVTELARHAGPTTGVVTAGAWQTVCDRGDPADLGVLLANVVKTSSEAAGERLATLARWRRDPRLGEALVLWLETPPYSSRSSSAFWLAAIRTCGDPRVVAACDRAVVGTLARLSAGTHLVPRIAAACDALRAMVADLAVLNATDRATVEHLLAEIASWDAAERSRGEMEAMFLARVREDPDDDNPRLVFADWLTEHGDERGELIALQFARHDNSRLSVDGLKREHALERKHGVAWLGSLAHELRRGRMMFDRGLVSEVW